MRTEAGIAASVVAGLLLGAAWIASQRLETTPLNEKQANVGVADATRLPRDLESRPEAQPAAPYPGPPPTLPELARADDKELREESAALLDALTAEAADGE